jgi:hypothetical protein
MTKQLSSLKFSNPSCTLKKPTKKITVSKRKQILEITLSLQIPVAGGRSVTPPCFSLVARVISYLPLDLKSNGV